MRTFALATAFALAAAAPATVFQPGQAPRCYISGGRTIVEYTRVKLHPSFKCAHTGNSCKCVVAHPTHHTGRCMQFDHTDGTKQSFSGDCSKTGLNVDAINGGSVDGQWSAWNAGGSCSKTCGFGSQTFTRTCVGQAHGGKACAGSASKSQACNTQACPVDGTWSGFTYRACSRSCGAGKKLGTRTCDGRLVHA